MSGTDTSSNPPRLAVARSLVALLLAMGLAAPACADKLPLWEAGAGVAALRFPDYRGSDEYRNYLFPIPYLVYRGDVLQVDRNKVRGLLFQSDIAEFDVSVNGSVPVRSDKNRARQGMPDLDPTLEIGPSINFFLHRDKAGKFDVDLRLPLRAVIATDLSHTHNAGWLFAPHINVDLRDSFPGPGWHLGMLAGPIYGSRRYHDYFYGVAPAYATAERPAYQAGSGYSGSQLIVALSKRFPKFWVGAFVKADSLHGATFENSPLMRTKSQLTAGFAVSWVFAQSSTLVEARN
jgi:outer membrane scaffolding protein for murein synthesis (MipA/OmpV family)